MKQLEYFLASALEKVFPGKRPRAMEPGAVVRCFSNETAQAQLVYLGREGERPRNARVEWKGGPVAAQLFKVELVPGELPCYEACDDQYLTKEPGLFPDLLVPLENGAIRLVPRQYRAVWMIWDLKGQALPGDYPVEILIRDEASGEPLGPPAHITLRVGKAALPPQKLIHTQWFHGDCLADYYHVKPLSEQHFLLMERFIQKAAELQVNMILTPVFTPPLDTAVGGERPTVQLVGVTEENGSYRFDFALLRAFLQLLKKHGVSYVEIPHLFTQWGAKYTPKIIGTRNGREEKLFGWHVPALDPGYRRFLEAFLPALRVELQAQGFDREHVFYHISDEPGPAHYESYEAAYRQVKDLLSGCRVIDAVSSIAFYHRGVQSRPVAASDHIQPFLDEKVRPLWVYYCCSQSKDVPNRFFALPSARNRIMGVLMYLYQMEGFLHWGFNFYFTQLSLAPADPYRVTDGGCAFPAGDPFLVYPGRDGRPLSSIRAQVQLDGLQDLRALELMESVMGREAVLRLIYDGWEELRPFTFTRYPLSPEYLENLRARVHQALEAANEAGR